MIHIKDLDLVIDISREDFEKELKEFRKIWKKYLEVWFGSVSDEEKEIALKKLKEHVRAGYSWDKLMKFMCDEDGKFIEIVEKRAEEQFGFQQTTFSWNFEKYLLKKYPQQVVEKINDDIR